MSHRAIATTLSLTLSLLCAMAPAARGADAPVPATPAAPSAPAAAAPATTQPEVNESFLKKCSSAADVLVSACKATGVSSKLGGLVGGGDAAKGDDRLKLAQGFKTDLQSLSDNKKVASDGAFTKLTTSTDSKDGFAAKFKDVPAATKLQSVFGDGTIGKALLDATPVDKVPGYQKSLETLQSLTK